MALNTLTTKPGVKSTRDLVIAIAIHGVLLALLLVSVDWSDLHRPASSNEGAAVVKATVIDDARVKAKEDRRKAAERQAALKRKREAAQRRKLAERQAALKRKREAAQRRKLAEKQAALKDKREVAQRRKLAERQAALKRKREAAQRRKVVERQAAQKRKREAEQARKLAERQAALKYKRKAAQARKLAEKQAELKRQRALEARHKADEEKALQAQLLAEEQQLTAERDRRIKSVIDHYIALIQQKVARKWLRPTTSKGSLSCTVSVRLAPDGGVLHVRIVTGSGDAQFDRSVLNAVDKASPLPIPRDRALYDEFREFKFLFKPQRVD